MKPERLWLVGTCIGASVISGALAGVTVTPRVSAQTADTASRIVTAQRFVLIDKTGKPLATLGIDETPGVTSASLIIGDQAGRNRVVLGMVGDRSVLQFIDTERNIRMTAGTDGTTSLVTFFDPITKRVRMMLGTGADGTPQVSLHDKTEKSRLSLYLTRDQQAVVTLADEREVTRASLGFSSMETVSTGATEQSPSSLVLSDKDGKVILKLP